MSKLYNIARMSTATVGTGTITLGSAATGFLSFAGAGVSNGETVTYAIEDGVHREIGRGVYTTLGTTLTRTVLKSTNSDTAISLSGTAEVFITPAKEDIANLGEANTFTGVQTLPNSGLRVLDTNASHGLVITPGSDLTADRILTVTTGDSARTLTLNGDITPSGQGKQTIWMPATAMIAATTNGPATGTVEQTTNKNMTKTLDFDTTTSEIAQFFVAFPKSWNLGTVTFIPHWTAASGSGTVIWALSGVAISNDDTLDVAFGTAQSSSDTLITAYDNHVGPESSAITIAGTPAVGDLVNFKLVRDISDTLGVDAKLIGIQLFYTTSAATDA